MDLGDVARTNDLVVENLGPGGLEARGLGLEALQARNPRLSLVSISPFGLSGPWAARPATEFTLQAATGGTAFRGHPDRGPVAAGPLDGAVEVDRPRVAEQRTEDGLVEVPPRLREGQLGYAVEPVERDARAERAERDPVEVERATREVGDPGGREAAGVAGPLTLRATVIPALHPGAQPPSGG